MGAHVYTSIFVNAPMCMLTRARARVCVRVCVCVCVCFFRDTQGVPDQLINGRVLKSFENTKISRIFKCEMFKIHRIVKNSRA